MGHSWYTKFFQFSKKCLFKVFRLASLFCCSEFNKIECTFNRFHKSGIKLQIFLQKIQENGHTSTMALQGLFVLLKLS